jgi:uncharacterized protein YgiM (DUF1202 family)
MAIAGASAWPEGPLNASRENVALLCRRVDRRVLVKAGAAFAAMAAAGGITRGKPQAQNVAETIAGEWRQAENVGAFDASLATPQQFQADFTFFAAAPHWSGIGDPAAIVEMSFSPDGETWGDPVTVGAATGDAGPVDLDGRYYGNLVLLDGANYIRYQALDVVGGQTVLPELAFTYINAVGGPSIDDVYSAALEPSIQEPPIISREMWGADERYRHKRQSLRRPILWPPEYQEVEHAIIHHTVTPNFEDPLVAIRSVYYYHAVTRGWGDIGYNYLVDYMGNVYEGRYGGENVIGGHAYQYAHGSSGIGLMGTFEDVSETPEAQAGLIWITAWVTRGLDPLGSADFHEKRNLPTICGHRDVWDSTCPGDAAYANLDWIRESVADVLANDVDPEPDYRFSEGDEAEVSSDTANLRGGPGTDYSIVSVLAYGTPVTITDGPTTNNGYTWYEVGSSQGSGWIAQDFLTKTADAPSGEFSVGETVAVNTDFLNLRASASTTGSILAAMPNGTVATVVDGPASGSGLIWYQLNTSYGTGWSVGTYLKGSSGNPGTSQGEFQSGDEVFVDTDRLNLRSEPGTGKSVLATLTQGNRLTITGGPQPSGGYDWYSVSSSTYGEGWSAGDFLSKAGSSPPSSNGEFANGQIVVVDTDVLRLRSAPGLGSATLAYLPNGTRVKILGGPRHADAMGWYKVRRDVHGEGWCAEEFLAELSVSSLSTGESVRIIDGALNLRSDAGTEAEVVTVLPDGARLTVTGDAVSREGRDWLPVRSSQYGSGWAAAEFLQPVLV